MGIRFRKTVASLKRHPIRISNSIASENSRKINRREIIQEGGVEVVCDQRVKQTTGNWADTKDGVSIWFPVFAGFISCWHRRGDSGASLRDRFYLRKFIGWRLLVDAYRISLAVQFGEKRFFVQRTAGSQQFQEWIFRVGCGAAGLA